MSRWLIETLKGPQTWLTVGAVLIAFSFAARYHQDQTLADVTLAQRIDLPSPVAIQAFSQDQHTNMLQEFQLLAEVDIGAAGVRTVGEGAAQEAYLLVPAYPLSDGGRHRANLELRRKTDASALMHRPVARPNQSRATFPVAILVYDISASPSASLALDQIGLTSLGAGFNGDVVVLAGTMFDLAMWQDALTGTAFDAALVDFIGADAEFLPLIAPYRDGNSAGGVGLDLSQLEYIYFAVGLAALVCGGVILLKRRVPGRKPRHLKARVGTLRKPSLPPFSFFQPIVSQEDLIDADQDVPPSAQLPKFMMRAVDTIVRGATPRFKSRL